MARVVGWIDRGLWAVAATCLALLFGLVVFQVIGRYVWGGVPLFTEETARYAMIWMALVASAVGVRQGAHIRVDFVPAALGAVSARGRRVLEALLDVVSLTAFLVLVWYGIDTMIFAAGQTSEGMRIPLSYPYSALPVSFAFASLFAILRVVAGARGG